MSEPVPSQEILPDPAPPSAPGSVPQYEPPTSFKWVIIAAVAIWSLGAAMIFLKWF